MSDLIITVSGLRGIVGTSLTDDIARRYAAAFAQGMPEGLFVVTRDGRDNGPQLVAPVCEGLMQGGATKILDGQVAATPTTGILVRKAGAVGGVQISASHNPPEYNGLKLFSSAGRVLPATLGKEVLERFHASSSDVTEKPTCSIQTISDTTSEHWSLVAQTVNLERIHAELFRVLLDANHGSGSVLGERLLEELGCQVTVVGATPDGKFSHPPEPTAENLAGVVQQVVQANAAIGFCQDPDADRLALIDENGRYLGEEYTLAICVNHVLRAMPGPIVTNCSTSRMSEDLANLYGVGFHRSGVGEANVVDKMLEVGAILGGEGNGGCIDPRVGLVRDSFVGMALVLDAMAERNLPISALADELPCYSICKTKIELAAEDVADGLDALQRHFGSAAQDRLDGLRLDWPDQWLLVRASNTEPIVRAVAEAPSAEDAGQLCAEAAAVLSMQ